MAKSMIHEQVHSAAATGTFTIGGDLIGLRLGVPHVIHRGGDHAFADTHDTVDMSSASSPL